jgi:Trypsin-like peptidase domain
MSTPRLVTLTILLVLCSWTTVAAQGVGQVFDSVNSSVVVIKAKGHDVADAGDGLVGFGETGSGVLISADGKVMTASHVVQAMDEINVEFLGGETVRARVVASEPAADISLLQLDRVPAGVKPARLGNSDNVRVGNEVIVIGALRLEPLADDGSDQRALAPEHRVPPDAHGGALPDQCRDQHRQLWRPDVQHGRRGHRHCQPHHLQVRR